MFRELEKGIIDVDAVREDFPILDTHVHGKKLVYLDNAATTQKPKQVVEALDEYYFSHNANIHRGVHKLSVLGTELYEETRRKMAEFIGLSKKEELIFTRGTTESINLVAYSWASHNLVAGDEILLTEMEHHANIVPWQLLAESKGCNIKFAPVTDEGEIDLEAFQNLLTHRTKLASFVHVSNTLGTLNPVREMTRMAKEAGAKVLIDGAQAVQHTPLDLTSLGCDFYAFSGHKLYGPTGIGFLWGREELLEKMPPFISGGDMIKRVSKEGTTFNDLPYKFEAGTPSIAPAIGMGAAIDYIAALGLDNISEREYELTEYLTEKLEEIDGVEIIGTSKNKTSVCSFVVEGAHPNDIGTMLDLKGIAVRTGHHCTMPLMDRFGLSGTTRASLAFYNTHEEIDFFADSLRKTLKMLR